MTLRTRIRWLRLELLMRRRIRVVLWGATRPTDLQAGSADDRARARRLDRQAAQLLAFRRFAAQMRTATAGLGVTFKQAAEALARTARTLDNLLTPEARQRIADAELEAECRVLGLPVRVDPTLKPGEWRIEP